MEALWMLSVLKSFRALLKTAGGKRNAWNGA